MYKTVFLISRCKGVNTIHAVVVLYAIIDKHLRKKMMALYSNLYLNNLVRVSFVLHQISELAFSFTLHISFYILCHLNVN